MQPHAHTRYKVLCYRWLRTFRRGRAIERMVQRGFFISGRCASTPRTAVPQRRGSDWARSSRLRFEFGRWKPVGRAVPSLRSRPRLPARAGPRATPRCPACAACSAGSGCSAQDVVQRVRRGRVRERVSPGDKVSETLPSGTVRDQRVERLAGVPRTDQRPAQCGECPERLADRDRLVAELRFAGARGFAIRSADDPVMGLHHRISEERLPLDGADRENREAAVVRELAEPVGEVALPLPAQPNLRTRSSFDCAWGASSRSRSARRPGRPARRGTRSRAAGGRSRTAGRGCCCSPPCGAPPAARTMT